MAPPVRIVPLGGLGEVGMNCMAIEADGRIVVVDCGVMFPNEPIGVELIAPDLGWLRERKERVDAVLLTHGHEDHIGGLGFLLQELKVPVYGTRFTLALARSRLAEAFVEADLREVRAGDVVAAGPTKAEFIATTHSIPDGCAIALETPQGRLLHTGDFKIDESPIDGRKMDLPRIEALGKAGLRLLLSDSTNAEREGVSMSESAVGPALERAFEGAPGRVFVACFASNIHRIQQVANAARAFGRRLALLGRSMEANVGLALDMKLLTLPAWQLCSTEEARGLPPRELCVLTTGTQGEPRSALARLARGEHPELGVAPGDLVVLSSRFIPGNELAVGRVVNDLCRRGAAVAYEGLAPLHVSGHAQAAEQRRLIQLARPGAFVPIHGEYRHLARHAGHAAAEGVPARHLLTDGDVLRLTDAGAEVEAERAPTGRIYADRSFEPGADIAEFVLKDRRLLAEAGLVLAILVVDQGSGAVVRGPELFARGVAGFDEKLPELRGECERALAEMTAASRRVVEEVQETLRLAVRRFFRHAGERKPSVLPVVLEL